MFRRILWDVGRNARSSAPNRPRELCSLRWSVIAPERTAGDCIGKGSTGARGGQRCPGGRTVTSLRGQEAQVPLDGSTRSGALVNTRVTPLPPSPPLQPAKRHRGHGAVARPPQHPREAKWLHLKTN